MSSPFCFDEETWRLIESSFSPKLEPQNNRCSHNSLPDHSLCRHNACTDLRAWSNDPHQQRQHFLDVISGRVKICNTDKELSEGCPGDQAQRFLSKILQLVASFFQGRKKEELQTPLQESIEHSDDLGRRGFVNDNNTSTDLVRSETDRDHRVLQFTSEILLREELRQEPIENSVYLKVSVNENLLTNMVGGTDSARDLDAYGKMQKMILNEEDMSTRSRETLENSGYASFVSNVSNQDEETTRILLDDLPESQMRKNNYLNRQDDNFNLLTNNELDSLDTNLGSLEEIFYTFINKNRDFIQNLVQMLYFEKHKLKLLQDKYNNLKKENLTLKKNNDHLEMVHMRQSELFKTKLQEAINNNKACYTERISQLEKQFETEKAEMKMHYKNKRKKLDALQNQRVEIDRLNEKVNDLKRKKNDLLQLYIELLNFMQHVKETLSSNNENKDTHPKVLSDTITDCKSHNLNEVLKTAYMKGMESLNVRDLSILHDAIQQLNTHLCHQIDYCVEPSVLCLSDSNLSMKLNCTCMNEGTTDYNMQGCQDLKCPSNLSFIPTREIPEENNMYCNGAWKK